MFNKICINCNKEFSCSWKGKKLCSNKCRYERQRGRKRISDKIGWNLSIIHNSRKGKTLEELYGKEKAKEIRNNLRNAQKKVNRKRENNPFYGKTHTKEFKEKIKGLMSGYSKERWENKEFKEKTIRKVLKSLLKRPSSFERRFIDYFNKNKLNFEYVGNGIFFINGLNPDFINKERKIVIEVFYSWFKIRNYGSVENYINIWSKKYNEVGWIPIFISEDIIKNKNFNFQITNLLKPYLEQEKLV